MFSLPQLIAEDINAIDMTLEDMIDHSDASAAFLIDKGGFIVTQQGSSHGVDIATLSALAANTYAATQAIAQLIEETTVSSLYQEGKNNSLLTLNVDRFTLLVVVFAAGVSVGAVKYYSTAAAARIAQQFEKAFNRAPEKGVDLAELNVADTSDVFRKRGA